MSTIKKVLDQIEQTKPDFLATAKLSVRDQLAALPGLIVDNRRRLDASLAKGIIVTLAAAIAFEEREQTHATRESN